MSKIRGGYYIKARSIQESAISKSPPHFRDTWEYCISHALFKPKGNLKRGQLYTTTKQIREKLSWYVGYRKESYKLTQIKKAIAWLKAKGMIETRKTQRGMVITVVNYHKYQDPKNYEIDQSTYSNPYYERAMETKPQVIDSDLLINVEPVNEGNTGLHEGKMEKPMEFEHDRNSELDNKNESEIIDNESIESKFEETKKTGEGKMGFEDENCNEGTTIKNSKERNKKVKHTSTTNITSLNSPDDFDLDSSKSGLEKKEDEMKQNEKNSAAPKFMEITSKEFRKKMKDYWHEFYFEFKKRKQNYPYWDGKDAGSLRNLGNRIVFTLHEHGTHITEEKIMVVYMAVLKYAQGENLFKKNPRLSVVVSLFNTIFADLKEGKNKSEENRDEDYYNELKRKANEELNK